MELRWGKAGDVEIRMGDGRLRPRGKDWVSNRQAWRSLFFVMSVFGG